MSYTCKTGTERDIEIALNNALVLGPVASNSNGLGGKTLIFTAPSSDTVTFTGATGAHVTLEQMLTDLAGVSGLVAKAYRLDGNLAGGSDYIIAIYHASGLTVDKDGTANSLLGVPTGADTAMAAPMNSTKIVAVTPGSIPGQYLLVYENS